ncbi:MAG: DUF1254 domain-containing protein [Rhizobiales bacterium]|nr:DUF1254 domain-containing protein [Hyphomicrobiales bacterium]
MMNRRSFTLFMALATSALVAPQAFADAATMLTAEDAQSIATDAYIYFYPLITMDITRKQLTNMEPSPGGIGGPMNRFANIGAFPTADMRVVVRPNFDTLYSSGWVDLTKEPVIVSAPDTDGRYYLLPMLDMWTDVFASPGWRTTGTGAGDFLVTPPGWTGTVPDGMSHIPAPTPYVWIIGRTKTDGPSDYDAVHKIQDGYKITPLSQWGKTPVAPEVKIDPTIDMKTPPKIQVDTMSGEKYFAYAAELLKLHPPHITDQPIIARLKQIGFEAGKSFDPASADAAVQKAIQAAPAVAQQLMKWKMPTLARIANGWSMNTDTMGVYGNYYLKRALVSQWGLGANLPEDAIYPLNLADGNGQPLDGANNYVLHFEKGATPPVDAFWSVTLYDTDGFQVANALNRFAVSSWMPFVYNADGSLDLYFQNASPGADKEANWLPAPKGPFNLTMRLYAPRSDALTGKWNPPPVMKEAAPAILPTQ